MEITDFHKAFRDGSRYSSDYLGDFRVKCQTIGRLVVSTGRIVACDPFVCPERKPFTQKVPAGRYPVIVSIAHLGKGRSKDQRIACAMLRISRRRPERWKMAVLPGQSLRSLKPGNIFGYGVDAGLGCFMDAHAAKLLKKKMDEQQDYYEVLMEAEQQTYVHTRSWADFKLDKKSKANIVFFSTGFGDGFYPSYWGYDADGEVACLVTDFGLLDEKEDDEDDDSL